eukprot:390735-Pelagomonas_calceolata.AAC.1
MAFTKTGACSGPCFVSVRIVKSIGEGTPQFDQPSCATVRVLPFKTCSLSSVNYSQGNRTDSF